MDGGGCRDTKKILGNIGNDDFDFGRQGNKAIEPEHDKTNKMTRVHGEDAGQPRNPPNLISLRCALS